MQSVYINKLCKSGLRMVLRENIILELKLLMGRDVWLNWNVSP